MGIDPFLMSAELYQKLDEVVTNSCKSLVPISTNLVDLVWQSEAERPPHPTTPVFMLPLKYAGESKHPLLLLLLLLLSLLCCSSVWGANMY